MIISPEKSIKKIIFFDSCFYIFSKLACWFLLFCFLFFFSFILFKGSLGIWHYGLEKIFLHLDFNLNSTTSNVSFWSPLFITLLLSIFVIVFCIPFSIKCAVWLTFFSGKKTKKIFTFLIELLSTFPSIIFGLFVRNYISDFLKIFFGLQDTLNIMLAIVTLLFMTAPLIISLISSTLKDNFDLIKASMALGISKEKSIYKVAFPNIKNTLVIAITIIFSKIISESIALSFLLSSENYESVFRNGFFAIFTSKLNPISTLIAENFFSDGAGVNGQNLLFAFSFMLLGLSLFINNLIIMIVKDKSKRGYFHETIIRFFYFLKKNLVIKPILYFSQKYLYKNINVDNICLRITLNKLKEWRIKTFFFNKKIFLKNQITLNNYISKYHQKNLGRKINSFFHKFWEIFSITILLMFVVAIISAITIRGLIAINNSNNFWELGTNTWLRAAINTFVIIILSMSISLPISLLSAIYLSEFCKNEKTKKRILTIINVGCATPSIVYGVFGLSFFLYGLGISSAGIQGKSLLSGILTISLFITCHLVNIFHTYFKNIPPENKYASYALGISKFATFSCIVWPTVKENLISVILMHVGKILGETAPLYLTAGLNSVSITHLMYPGQTLTTRIYSQLYEHNLKTGLNNMFESAFMLMLLMFLLMYFVKFVFPYINKVMMINPKIVIKYYYIKIIYYLSLLTNVFNNK